MARLRLGVSAVVVCNPRLLSGAVYANVQAKLTDTAHEFFVRRAPETASIAADGGTMSVSTYPGHPIVTGASDSSLIRGPIDRTGGLLSREYG